ncbi:hypothetical protein WM2015_981 [Wenzhouxiangella marina]|uniref:Uncharacterized protein n=2 Tax=Wenzhouxiangella marina TaxID=1579979 RepID=A0A0K0XUL6_9GAMM|nr:hypothetical protein WM2015_981 [Wenzhouxiangella marina]
MVTELAEAGPLAEPIFQRKYGAPAPAHGHHLLVFCRCGEDWLPGSYLNYLEHRDAMLIGGACTDGRVLARMSEAGQAAVRDAGGLMLQAVRYGEARFASCSVGTFGHCGDARSWSVLAQCGYERLDDPHLIVRWNRRPAPWARRRLIRSVAALGPF